MSQSYGNILRHYDPAVLEMNNALQLAKSSGASQEVISSIEKALDLVEKREAFTHNATTKQSATCQKIVEETMTHDWKSVFDQGKSKWHFQPGMMSGPLEGQFLKFIVSMSKAKRVLDIGMFTGYSAQAMCEALPADGEVVTLDQEDYLKTLVTDLTKTSPHHKKIKIIIDNAVNSTKAMAAKGEQFDVIFLDADKTGYVDYMKCALDDNLLRAGGTIVVDNAYLRGKGYTDSDSPTSKFAKEVTAREDLSYVLVPIRDGVMLIRRKADVEGRAS